MPYVPSEKSEPKAQDRKIIDAAVEPMAKAATMAISSNLSLIETYCEVFRAVATWLNYFRTGPKHVSNWPRGPEYRLAQAIWDTGATYEYEGAYLGELNYAMTRFIQRVPRMKVEAGEWKDEFRYWLYAATVEALTHAAAETLDWGAGVSGVFTDIKDEYKRRVNTSYEAAQILKNGDCYDTPYYTKLVEVVDDRGNHVGYIEIMVKRSDWMLKRDLLDVQLVLRTPPL
jgi:hypothetical protein